MTQGAPGEPPEPEVDPRLRPFLAAGSDAEAGACLESLLSSVAEPVALRVVRQRLHTRDADHEDVASEVVLQLLARLKRIRAEAEPPRIADFEAYVASAARNACHDHLRARHPRRSRLKSRVRYLVKNQPGFAAWTDALGETACGFSEWQASGARASARALDRLRTDPGALTTEASGSGLADLLAALFDGIGGAVSLEDLVDAVARILDVHDAPAVPIDDVAGDVAVAEDPLSALDGSAALKRLWEEITALPPRQRAALLLNLRDPGGRDVIALLPQTGTASMREIATALAIPAERLAALWADLPMEDAGIAGLLGVTRQQVINLRKCARERLGRRLGRLPAEARR
jgi:RNA polymerase sigma factor (sigma-70 family)